MARLRIVGGEGVEQVLDLSEERLQIGRGRENGLVLPGPEKGVSRTHAELRLENTGHPAANTFTLAHPSRSHVNALGLAWDDVTGKNNGQYAPFSWQSA